MSTRAPTRLLLVLVLVGVVLGALFWLRARRQPQRQGPAELTDPARPAAPATEAGSVAPSRRDRAGAAATGNGTGAARPVRTPLPRPTADGRADAEHAGSRGADDASPNAARSGPLDRRETPPPGAELLREALETRLAQVEASVETCLRAWRQADAAFTGRVVLAFQIGADGLQEAWVQDLEEVPFGPLTCVGAAVYEVDWAGLSPEPIEITVPFELDSSDAGVR